MPDLTPQVGQNRRLYVRLEGVSSLVAADVVVLWAPGGGEDPAYAVSNWGAPAGSNCTWILRGTVLKIEEHSDSTFHLAATGTLNTSCSAGNLCYIDFSDPPAGTFPPGRFVIASVSAVDANGATDVLAIGAPATILLGTVPPAPRLTAYAQEWGYVGWNTEHYASGQNFVAPTGVSLVRAGSSPIAGSVTQITPSSLKIQFAFADADTGRWSVRVENPGGRFSVFDRPLTVVKLGSGGQGIAGGYNRVILTLKPGTLPLTGPRPVESALLTAGSLRLRESLRSTSARTVQCLWPDLLPQRTSVTNERGESLALFDFGRVFEVAFDSKEAADAAILVLRADPDVVSANPSHRMAGAVVCNPPLSCGSSGFTNDPDFGRPSGQWYLKQNETQADLSGGRIGEDTQTMCAWDLERPVVRGNRAVTLAILDTGIDVNHPDLAYTYSQQGWGQRILAGHNVFDGSQNVTDVYGHGTMVAGVAAARTFNGVSWTDGQGVAHGIAGVAGGWAPSHADSAGVRILPVKVLDDENFGNVGTFALGINWAAQNGAKIINLSVAGAGDELPEDVDSSLREALYNAMLLGATCIAGTGNSDDSLAWYPAKFAAWGLVTAVGGTDQCGSRATDLGPLGGSSFGSHIDVVAPSTNIYSTLPLLGGDVVPGPILYGQHGFGTSFACALTSGVAASLKGLVPTLNDVDIKHLLRETAVNVYSDPYVEVGKGRIAHREAVRRVDPALGMAVVGGILNSHSLVDSVTVALVIKASGLPGVADGTYTAKRYDLTFTTTFALPFVASLAPIAWVRVVNTKGWTRESPHLFNYGGGRVLSLSTTGAAFSTSVYRIPALGNLFVPNSIADARLDYRAAGKLSGTTSVTPSPARGQIELRVVGSPASRGVGIAFEVSGGPSQTIEVDIVDVRGRRVARLHGEPDTSGKLVLRWAGSPGGPPILSGLYFARARQADRVATARAIILN